jgi:SAM-dependent methyltransferase
VKGSANDASRPAESGEAPGAAAARVNACPWCRSTDAVRPWPGIEPPDFQVRRCRACGHHFTVPVLGPDEIGAYYQETYYGTTNRRFNPLMEWLVGGFRDRRARALERFVQPGKVLDVGCGRGLTLASLRKRGWTTRGCELSETSARHAREVLGLDVDCDGFNPDRYADAEFDAVILWHVYEHLADARAALETCARIVRPGGVLALAVPNFDSYQARWTRYAWFHLDMPRHYSHFSAPWLRDRFRELGFRVIAENHTSLEQNPYGWIQSMLNRWGLRRNLLYDILRRGSARTVANPWSELPMQSLLSVAGMGILLPMALSMLPVESLTRRGATVDFYAVRESN